MAVLALLLAACGVEGNRFQVEGHFLKLNRGEFYVYSTNGLIDGVDTRKLEAGRFVYEIPCERSWCSPIFLNNPSLHSLARA